MTRRVVIGKYNDGVTFGLRVSLPGIDALTDSSADPGKFSFDSEWTDVALLHQVSLSSWSGSIPSRRLGGTTAGWMTTWPALGYKPMIEARLLISNVIYDDYFPNGSNPSFVYGSLTWIDDAWPNETTTLSSGSPTTQQLMVMVYKISAPSQ